MAIAIVLAGGESRRMGKNKQLMQLAGRPVVVRSIEKFTPHVEGVILVVPKELRSKFEEVVDTYRLSKVREIVDAEDSRPKSVYKVLKTMLPRSPILIHNGANPLVTGEEIKACINATVIYGAAAVAHLIKDTLKEVDKDGLVIKTLDRSIIRAMQTPQGMRYDIAVDAFKKVVEEGISITDDVQAAEAIGVRPFIVSASPSNIKLTTPEDIIFAEAMLAHQGGVPIGQSVTLYGPVQTGVGKDSHPFMEKDSGKPLVIGGVTVPGEPGFKGNSDGDVIYHALCRALSCAVGGPSLSWFADDLAKSGKTDSSIYLKLVKDYVLERNYEIVNVSVHIEALKPRISEEAKKQIRANLKAMLGLGAEQIGLEFHSGEKLTSFGRGEGVYAEATANVRKMI